MSESQKIIKIVAIALAMFIIILIINGFFFAISLFSKSNRGSINFSEYYSNINNIEIEANKSSVKIVKGDKFLVEASGVSNNFKVRNKNNKLEIEENGNWLFNSSGEIIIYVTNNLNELVIDGGNGKINIDSIIANHLELDIGAGLIEINESTFYNSEIDGGAGLLKATSTSFTNLDLDAGIGKVELDGEILGNSKIDGGIGEINLNLTNESLYRFIIDSGIGVVKINEKKVSSVYGNGQNLINIDNGIGTINIKIN